MAQLNLPIGPDTLRKVEHDIRLQRSVIRYRRVRRFCYGRILDFGCGTGYGARILRENPDVDEVCEYDPGYPDSAYIPDGLFHVLVALEVAEHLARGAEELAEIAFVKAEAAIVSFPDLASTRFNEHHLHDLSRQDVVDAFGEQGFMPWHAFRLEDSQVICFLRRPRGMPAHVTRNLLDL